MEFKLYFLDDKSKRKAMETVSLIDGIELIALSAKDKKMTVIGDIDPVIVAATLRKVCRTQILTVGTVRNSRRKEPKKKEPKNAGDEKKKDELLMITLCIIQPYSPDLMGLLTYSVTIIEYAIWNWIGEDSVLLIRRLDPVCLRNNFTTKR
ncbi:hypothetical protein Vadar_034300 [Vaccinium darrowii]|uniref:Uncharacterized protein n=1 Tax=Vaccinium darrowii TaxID=229202 RepID=A0ACB7X6N9_9ERIC|nr:hypothetical protein Vadar_034300 [Vaccinium darrowii]